MLADHRVYTPQMVVNGTTGFVGSYRHEAKKQIADALTQKARVGVDLSAVRDRGLIVVDYEPESFPQDTVLNVALVERDINVDVPRGENAGRSLDHHNVVRVFKQITPQKDGRVKLTAPEDADLKKLSVIGYVQDRKTLEIMGASEARIKQEE